MVCPAVESFAEEPVICPHCGGKGQIRSHEAVTPCEYEGCHCGHIHCCDPQSQQYAEKQAEKVSAEGIKLSDIEKKGGDYYEGFFDRPRK